MSLLSPKLINCIQNSVLDNFELLNPVLIIQNNTRGFEKPFLHRLSILRSKLATLYKLSLEDSSSDETLSKREDTRDSFVIFYRNYQEILLSAILMAGLLILDSE